MIPIVSDSWATPRMSPVLFPKFQASGLHFDVQDLNEPAPIETVLFCPASTILPRHALEFPRSQRHFIGVFSMKQRLSTSSDNDVNANPLLAFYLQGEEYANDILAAQDSLAGSQPVSGCPLYVHGLANLKRETGVCLPDVLLCQQDCRAI